MYKDILAQNQARKTQLLSGVISFSKTGLVGKTGVALNRAVCMECPAFAGSTIPEMPPETGLTWLHHVTAQQNASKMNHKSSQDMERPNAPQGI